MAGKQSADVDKALKLVSKGLTPHAAAIKVGIAISTIYRAIARQRASAAPKPGKKVGKSGP
jgi:hypothetical protein